MNSVSRSAPQAAQRTSETNQLIAEAIAAGTAPATALLDARRVAMALTASTAPWTQSAAVAALSGSDAEAMEFVHTGISIAAGQDDRLTLANLAASGTSSFAVAANTALSGSDADVTNFLQNPNYPQRLTDDRLAVNQAQSAARAAGNNIVVSAAQQALDIGTDEAFLAFLNNRRYTAAASDMRLKVNQVISDPNTGPELKGAALAALDGTPGMLESFLSTGRHVAAKNDAESAAHNALVAGYLKQANEVAETASQHANEAQASAATARGAAQAATEYAAQAHQDSLDAGKASAEAHTSAVSAEASARQAAASAATAKTAAAAATNSAHHAARSATWAESSARQAKGYAANAYLASKEAYDSWVAAGKDAHAALIAAGQALVSAIGKSIQDKKDVQAQQLLVCAGRYPKDSDPYQNCIHLATASDEDKAAIALTHADSCAAIWGREGVYYQSCLGDVLSPSFGIDQGLKAVDPILTGLENFAMVLAGIQLGVACSMSAICGTLVLSALPDGAAWLPFVLEGIGAIGGGLLGGRIGAAIETGTVAEEANAANLAEELAELASVSGKLPIGTVPQGLTQQEFADLSRILRQGYEQKYGTDYVDMVIQGSRAAGIARTDSDIDIAIRVSPERFDQLIAERFGTANPGSSKWDTGQHAIATGKIQTGELGVRGTRNDIAAKLGICVGQNSAECIDLSVIKIDGPFDKPPFIEVP